MKMKVITYEDLGRISGIFEASLDFYQMAAGPPASKPRKKPALCAVLLSNSGPSRVGFAYLTLPIKFIATKLAAKFSMRFQVRWSCCKKQLWEILMRHL